MIVELIIAVTLIMAILVACLDRFRILRLTLQLDGVRNHPDVSN
jgi:hypothetical protein